MKKAPLQALFSYRNPYLLNGVFAGGLQALQFLGVLARQHCAIQFHQQRVLLYQISFLDMQRRQNPSLYGLHSLRRTFPTHIYQQTGNLRAAQLLLGHASIESTKEYIGTEQAEALEIARKYHL